MGDYKHTSSLPKAVMDQIRPIFKDLSKTELLSKCLEGYTQNANESLNGLIWKLCPKVGNHGLVTVDISVGLAVSMFNCGASAFGQVLAQMGLCVGKFSLDFLESKDFARIQNLQRQAKQAAHKERRARRRKRLQQDEEQEEVEGFSYMTGGH